MSLFYHYIYYFYFLFYGNKNETEDLFKKYFFESKTEKKRTFHAIAGIISFYNFSRELKNVREASILNEHHIRIHQLSRQSSLKIFPCNKCKSVANRNGCR